jgi:transcriptional regulator with XRE-family HTH domain
MGQPSAGEETIGQRIRRLRLERGLSQRELSGPGVSYAYVSRIETGGRKPSLKAMRHLAARLGVSSDYIETGRPVPASADRELRATDAELLLRLDGDLADAAGTFRSLLDDADAEPEIRARALAGLGLIKVRRGDLRAASTLLEEAIGTGYLRPHERPDVYEELAKALAFTDEPGRAIVVLESALKQAREQGTDDAALEVRLIAYLACAYSDAGDAGRAMRLLREAAERVEAVASPQARVRVYWSLARLAWWEAQDSDAALRYAREALALYRTTEDTRGLAQAHLICAQLLNLERKWRESAQHLERADMLLTATGADLDDMAVLRAEQGKAAAWSGDGAEGLRRAQQADSILGERESLHQGAKWHAFAAAHTALGDVDSAEPYFQRALDFLTERRQWREAMLLAREWADVSRSLGQTDRALELMERASSFAFRIPPPARESEPRRSRA